MNKILEVYIAKEGVPDCEACATLTLPAMPYELLDAIDKLRLEKSDTMYMEVTEYFDFGDLYPYSFDKCSLLDLNALALKLGELDGAQGAAFRGLVKMEEVKKDGAVNSIPRLIDLAYSTESCHVVTEARNDFELGGFYAGNGFIPSVDGLSDELFEMLDFEKIGRELCRAEGGVFTSGGYVVRCGELNEVYENLCLESCEPDYQILLEAFLGDHGDPEYDKDNKAPLKLPADDTVIDAVLEKLCAASMEEIGWRCLDCRAPSLVDAVSGAESIYELNSFAKALADMDDADLIRYKAVLEFTECPTLSNAMEIVERLDDYTINTAISSFVEAASQELSFLMDRDEAERLRPFVDMFGYGRAAVERYGGTLTAYGLVEHEDREQTQTMTLE